MMSLLRIIIALLTMFSLNAYGKFYVKDSISLLGGFDTNCLYMESSSGLDYLMRVDPEVDIFFDRREFVFNVGGGIDYNRYFKNTSQSWFTWKFNGGVSLKPDEDSVFYLNNKYDNNSDPVLMDTETRAKWNMYSVRAGMDHKTQSKAWKFISGLSMDVKEYDDDDTYDNFNNRKAYIDIETRYSFFPETALRLGAIGGRSYYTAGYDVSPYGNSDSVYLEGFTGVMGRLTNDVSVDIKAGFLYLDYKYGTDFHEPVIRIKVTDLISYRTSLSAIYERMAYDSVYSNFYVDEKVSMEFKSIIYDSMASLSEFQYIYRYYRASPRRVDHRLGFITELSIPLFVVKQLKENISFTTKFMAEWVNSDAYNSFGYYTGPDPSASYSKMVFLVGLTNKF